MKTYMGLIVILLFLVAVFYPTSQNKITIEANCHNPIQSLQADTLYAFCLERKAGDDKQCQELIVQMEWLEP